MARVRNLLSTDTKGRHSSRNMKDPSTSFYPSIFNISVVKQSKQL